MHICFAAAAFDYNIRPFAWVISHQSVLFSQNKPTSSSQQTLLFSDQISTKPTSSSQQTLLFSDQISTNHQPNEQANYFFANCR
jgi:hypothetical protein